MANENNLKNGEATQFKTGEEQVEIARRGGIASGEAKRKKKAFKEYIENELAKEVEINAEGDKLSKKEVAVVKVVNLLLDKKTSNKDLLKAFEIIRDTIGEKPVERVEVNQIDEDTKNKVDELIKKCQSKSR